MNTILEYVFSSYECQSHMFSPLSYIDCGMVTLFKLILIMGMIAIIVITPFGVYKLIKEILK